MANGTKNAPTRSPAAGGAKSSTHPPLWPVNGFCFADTYFEAAAVDRKAGEVHLASADFSGHLYRLFTRPQLDRMAEKCRESILAKDSPTAVVKGVRQPFAHVLLENVKLVLAGGPREY